MIYQIIFFQTYKLLRGRRYRRYDMLVQDFIQDFFDYYTRFY